MEPFRFRRGLALSLSKGFTLIELMVVLAIIVVITTVVLTSQSSFNKSLILANTSYDIALSLVAPRASPQMPGMDSISGREHPVSSLSLPIHIRHLQHFLFATLRAMLPRRMHGPAIVCMNQHKAKRYWTMYSGMASRLAISAPMRWAVGRVHMRRAAEYRRLISCLRARTQSRS